MISVWVATLLVLAAFLVSTAIVSRVLEERPDPGLLRDVRIAAAALGLACLLAAIAVRAWWT